MIMKLATNNIGPTTTTTTTTTTATTTTTTTTTTATTTYINYLLSRRNREPVYNRQMLRFSVRLHPLVY